MLSHIPMAVFHGDGARTLLWLILCGDDTHALALNPVLVCSGARGHESDGISRASSLHHRR